ncbi:MAG TPA: MarR family transcriptional regulator [Pseudonocardiaceae bacterium]|nr:MarR family transcriptional regulator [Pseudonocardiaceae bacterium]
MSDQALPRPPGSADAPLTLYLVKQLEQVIRALLDDALRTLGLTTLQYTALSVLERRADGLSSAQLARRAFVRPQTMHEMVQALDERGLIERRHAANNQRVLLASLSVTGRDLLAQCRPVVQEVENRLLAGMSPQRRDEFRTALEYGHNTLADWARSR